MDRSHHNAVTGLGGKTNYPSLCEAGHRSVDHIARVVDPVQVDPFRHDSASD
jgi:hypothetical protein